MKKVLFATTALVLSAGFASAEVSLSGDGRMGVAYDGADWNFSSRARVIFTLSGQTDGGLEFGGSFKTSDGTAPANGTSGTVYVSGAFGKLEMGNVTSAPEALFGDLAEVGYLGDDQGSQDPMGYGITTNDIPYLTLDNHTQSALLYTYSAGAFSVAASMSDGVGDTGSIYGGNPITTPALAWPVDQSYAVAAAYTAGNYTVGLGYEKVNGVTSAFDAAQAELAGIATFGNTSLKAYYAKGYDNNPVDDALGLSVASVFGATTVSGYVQKVEFVSGADVTWYGIGAAYDLGGGASLAGGIQDDDISGSDPTANFGVKFTF